ncbi:MAG: hypothetical protein ACJAVK_001653, partial [Akkermansiaceae bacterium]
FGVVAEVPLAEAGGGVALALEVVGDGVFGGVESFFGRREEDMLVHADALGVAAGEEGGTGGGANRGGDHEVGELAAFGGEAVDIGGLDLGGAEAAEVAVALVIGEDDDEVGLVSGAGDEAGDQKNEEEDLAHEEGSCLLGRDCEEGSFLGGL